MAEFLAALTAFALLSASAAFGFLLRQKLADRHLSERNLEALRLVTGLLVTFAALVLSLLLASVKASFDTSDRDRRLYAAELTQLHQCMRNYGPELDASRLRLHAYVAAVIASTWPNESKPAGVNYPDPAEMPRTGEVGALATLMRDIGLDLARLEPADSFHQVLAARCRANFDHVQERRWAVIEDAQGSVSGPFAVVLMGWLMLVFVSFGLQAQRNAFTVVAIAMGALSVATVIFVIADLDTPYTGIFGIPSTAMRHALSDMIR